MKTITVLSIAASLILSASAAHAIIPVTYPYGYVFQETGGDPFSGELFLDQSSSVSGTSSDVSPSSFIDTPNFNFTLSQTEWSVTGTFSWNASMITSMDLTGSYETPVEGGYDVESFTLTDGGITETTTFFQQQPTDPGASGAWVMGVPDTASTALMLGIVGGAIGMARRRFGRKVA
jgi:hypothetical protein